jgi:hypothetical protein
MDVYQPLPVGTNDTIIHSSSLSAYVSTFCEAGKHTNTWELLIRYLFDDSSPLYIKQVRNSPMSSA